MAGKPYADRAAAVAAGFALAQKTGATTTAAAGYAQSFADAAATTGQIAAPQNLDTKIAAELGRNAPAAPQTGGTGGTGGAGAAPDTDAEAPPAYCNAGSTDADLRPAPPPYVQDAGANAATKHGHATAAAGAPGGSGSVDEGRGGSAPRREVRLLLCNRTYSDVLCVPELLQLWSDTRTESGADEAAACSRFTVSHALSAESGEDGAPPPPHWPADWNTFALRGGGNSGGGGGGRISEEVVRQALALQEAPGPSGAVALCCGSVGLMESAKSIMAKLGEDAVHCLDA